MSSAGSRNDRTSGALWRWHDGARPVPFRFPTIRAEVNAGPGTVYAGGHHGRVASYSPDQLRIAGILAAASRRPIIRKAIEEAGLVESNLTNVSGGDRDSTGVLQQRPSQGWGRAGESVATDASQFVRAAEKVLSGGFRGSAAQLAQAVQRSAFPARYAQRAGQAEALLGAAGGSSSPVSALVGAAGGPSGSSAGPANDVSGAVAALLSSARQAGPPVSGPMLPAHAAHAVMPQGYAPVASAPPVSTAPDVQALMDAVRTQGGSSDVSGGPSGSQTVNGGSGATSVSGAGGDVRVAAGANRPGANLTPGVLKLVRAVSATAGRPLTIGTGTNHNRMTVDGNVSDHWSGNAADLPTTPGQENIRLGRQALVALGVPQSQAAKAQGGIYNIPYGQHRRIQVIFNTDQGGDHHNHVHVGVTAK